MIMGDEYYTSMDRGYYEKSSSKDSDIEKPIVSLHEMGQSVTEGRTGGGTFLNSMQAAIFRGTGTVELALQDERSEPFVGAEAYGKQMRQDLRDLARINDVKIKSIHSPTWVGNLSGYAGQQQGFSDEYRAMQMEEVKKAIDFSADVAGGSAVVVHTGEFERPMYDESNKWNKDHKFRQYEEEAEKAVYPLIDKRTGRVLTVIRKDTPTIIPKWKVDANGEYIDNDGKVVSFEDRIPEFDANSPEKIKMEQKDWNYFIGEAKMRNKVLEQKLGRSLREIEKITPEEAHYQASIEAEQRFQRGWAMQYSENLDKMFDTVEKLKTLKVQYEEIEKNTPENEKWKLKRPSEELQNLSGGLIPAQYESTTEFITKRIKTIQDEIKSKEEMVVGQLQQAKTAEIAKDNVVSLWKYAKDKSINSYAELGIYAMQKTEQGKRNNLVKDDIFVAPENIFPEMGYGSHPEELIELVQTARKKMVDFLTKDKIPDPAGSTDQKTGEIKLINNPYYRGISKEEAEKEAKKHIKATLDTQHLGMWFKYFTPKPGETEDDRMKRFHGWYLDEVKKMEEQDIIGHLHIVDGFGKAHTHLPAGEGLMPIRSAVEYLKKKGYTGSMVSEGYGENASRQLTQTWAYFGSPIYSAVAPPSEGARSWTDVENSYFSKMQSPYFVFGAYAPSNDWTLWSGVPLE